MAMSQSTHDYSRGYATQLDDRDHLKHLRKEFIIPTIADLKSKKLNSPVRVEIRIAYTSVEIP